jgi:hypothetical protein
MEPCMVLCETWHNNFLPLLWEIKKRVVFKISILTWDYNSEGNYEEMNPRAISNT